MVSSEKADVASRVCRGCGLCCNGVLFEIVRLQPGDSVEELCGLGMKVGRKKRGPYFKQPCVFLEGCACSHYAARPARCRLFECRQLVRLAGGQASEGEVLRAIGEVKRKVAEVEGILEKMGEFSAELPLAERCERARERPGAEMGELEVGMGALKVLLDEGFRMGMGGE